MISKVALLSMVSALWFPTTAFGDPSRSDLKSGFKKMPRQMVASRKYSTANSTIDTPAEERGRRHLSPEEDIHGKLGVGMGLGAMTGSSFDSTSRSLSLGMQGDAQSKYFGISAEGYYWLSSKETAASDTDNMTQKQHAIAASLYGRYPIYLNYLKMVPKLGIGYGLMNIEQNFTREGVSGKETIRTAIKGPYLKAGFEIEPIRTFRLSIDYSRSIAAWGETKVDLWEGTSTSSESSGRFDRLRFAGFFYMTRSLILGIEYSRRSFSHSSSFSTDQLLALFMWQW